MEYNFVPSGQVRQTDRAGLAVMMITTVWSSVEQSLARHYQVPFNVLLCSGLIDFSIFGVKTAWASLV